MGQDSTWEVLVRLTKKNQATLRDYISQADGEQISFKGHRPWEGLDCVPDCLQVITDKWSPIVLATRMGDRPCVVMKMAKSCEVGETA